MDDVLALLALHDGAEQVAVATVVSTWSSAPRPIGSSMFVTADGTTAGSVSGGCVDGDVYEVAGQVLRTGRPEVRRYGVSDEVAGSVGLTCGGTIEILVERIDRAALDTLRELARDVEAGLPVAMATVVDHPDPAVVGHRALVRAAQGARLSGEGTGLDPGFEHTVVTDAQGLLAAGRSAVVLCGPDGERGQTDCRVLVEVYSSPPRMILAGVNAFALAVARLAHVLGYRVTVCEAREVFAAQARRPEVDEVVIEWPHRYLAAELAAGRTDGRTVVLVLAHDPRFDVPILDVALRSTTLGFVGALGSRRAHDDRLRRLVDVGLTDEHLARLSSPVGLDLGGQTPEETALSVLAEVVARRCGGSGAPLRTGDGPLHR